MRPEPGGLSEYSTDVCYGNVQDDMGTTMATVQPEDYQMQATFNREAIGLLRKPSFPR